MTTFHDGKLKLRGCETVFTPLSLSSGEMPAVDDDEMADYIVAQFVDSKNNTICIEQIVDKNPEENGSDVACFFDAIASPAYNYLVHTLNNSKDTTVYLHRFGDCDIDPIEFTIVHEPLEIAKWLGYNLSAGTGFMFNEVKDCNCDPEPIESLKGYCFPGADITNPEELKINGCDQVFTLFHWRKIKERLEEDDDPSFFIEHIRLYEDNKNNVIRFIQPRYKHEEVEDSAAVLDALPEAAYRYLANLFNENHDISVFLTQTTDGKPSDVLVIYEPYAATKKLKIRIKIDSRSIGNPQYHQFKDGKTTPIKALQGFTTDWLNS